MYKKGIVVTRVFEHDFPGAGLHFLPTVKEGEKFPAEDISFEQAYARAFRTILTELKDGSTLYSAEVTEGEPNLETDDTPVKIKLVFEND